MFGVLLLLKDPDAQIRSLTSLSEPIFFLGLQASEYMGVLIITGNSAVHVNLKNKGCVAFLQPV